MDSVDELGYGLFEDEEESFWEDLHALMELEMEYEEDEEESYMNEYEGNW